MGEVTQASLMIGIQYASSEIKHLEDEIKLFEKLYSSIFQMQNADMIKVESSFHAKLYRAYKEALENLNYYRIKEKQRHSRLTLDKKKKS